jgi:hypothetical protein
MGQRLEGVRENVPLANLLRVHPRQRRPGHAAFELRPHALLQGLTAEHRGVLRRPIGQVVALRQHILVALLYFGLVGLHSLHHRGEALSVLVHRHVARVASLLDPLCLDVLRNGAERHNGETEHHRGSHRPQRHFLTSLKSSVSESAKKTAR